jgi:hypothetical protein|tara:strand:- start:35 stop:463 length:429 start_codon:yes stop_codon:yes gene_type:complete
MTEWKKQQLALEDAFARNLLMNYNIKEVTTQKQALNGTREFEFPVPARSAFYSGQTWYSKDKLRLAVFKSGYVRNQNGCGSAYQINKQYKQNVRWTFLTPDGLETRQYTQTARALIYSGLARLNYMLEYYIKNYKNGRTTNR